MMSGGEFASTQVDLRSLRKRRQVRGPIAAGGFAVALFFQVVTATPRALAGDDKQGNEPKGESKSTSETNLSTASATPSPSTELLMSVISTVDVTIKTNKKVDFHSEESGGYAAIANAQGPLFITRGGNCSGTSSGVGEATFHGTFREVAGASPTKKPTAMGKPIAELRAGEFIQIEFSGMEENPVVVGGRVLLTLNASHQLRFDIPPQKGVGKRIYVRNLSTVMKTLGPTATPPDSSRK